ncbi:MAG: asparagine synthase-related protein [Actinomycetota bacterium]|nr:asparagine synthase-related protein [Actinomycetota bacterium]
MSGIAGIISKRKQPKAAKEVKQLLKKIRHRGSRQETLLEKNGCCLGMVSNDSMPQDSSALVDGRIYNIDQVSKRHGLNFRPGYPDGKKIKELVDAEGPSIIKEFQGAFSLALADFSNNFYLARDTIGIKPLYFVQDSDRVVFASEIKSLTGYGDKVAEFPPGHVMKNTFLPREYDSIEIGDYDFLQSMGAAEITDKLDQLLQDAVKKRIEGQQGEIGVWLSGGVDSSLIAALAKKFTSRLYTFSVGFEGSPDLEASRVVAQALGTRHIEHKLDLDQLYQTIPEVIYHLESFDAPLVRSSLGNMIASRISSRSDIVFSGEGGDEVFGGYNYFLDFDSSEKIQQELIKAINSLHNTALQRVDRLANAHNVKVRLPLLDENLIDFALTIPTKHKVKKAKNISKYILRKVAERYLPYEIAWRDKEKFWEGAGIQDTLTEKIEKNINDEYFEKNRKLDSGFKLRNKEEMYFYQLFKEYFGQVDVANILSFTQDFN